MFEKILLKVREEYDALRALEYVTRISGYHRVPASPGYRDAARYAMETLSDAGVMNELLSYPASDDHRWWSYCSFREWDARSAELFLEGDRRHRLCSYEGDPSSLIRRSTSTPPEGVRTSLVYVADADNPGSYRDIDVSGKIVLCDENPDPVARIAVQQQGALGVVVGRMNEYPPIRYRSDLADARQIEMFSAPLVKETTGFGFVITPRQADGLKKLLTDENELPVYARVDADLHEGEIEVVSMVIPGEIDEEVVAVAHLCHPQASANDNASGAATLMESARTLATLIREGRLPKPRRSIRFLLVPEMTGSVAYLASHEDRIDRTVAAIALDMVGASPDSVGALILEKPMRATSGFSSDVAQCILESVPREFRHGRSNYAYPLVNSSVNPYAGGSDHYVFAEPSVGISCPLLVQWPDRHYHTSEDTPDKVDPNMLRFSGTLASTYLYFLANAGCVHASWLAREMTSHLSMELRYAADDILDRWITDEGDHGNLQDSLAGVRRALQMRIDFLRDRKLADLRRLHLLCSDGDGDLESVISRVEPLIRDVADLELDRALVRLAAAAGLPDSSHLPAPAAVDDDEWESRADCLIPRRLFRGPLFNHSARRVKPGTADLWDSFQKKWRETAQTAAFVLGWMDGERTLSEIGDLVEAETGWRHMQFWVEYVEILREIGLVSL